ncbi:diacylglycerol O-acyltransferase 3, cytosolic [Durio zibethinus]|uniref:Diacylglycerol O-acyltransferase 3, cytosolic n=1 Tax=Durio zibethinus TaxID=66656 RepID=A0A6P6B0M1_DURZI|nr:diacylglycerol O-acyltransferase 3, cytosolic [Durio zibethinus]
METSGILYRTVLRLPTTRVDFGCLFSRELNLGVGDSRVSVRRRNSYGRLSCQFADSGHIRYYVSPRVGVGGGGDKKEKEKRREIKRVKKKLKFIKRLSKDLSMLPNMVDGKDIGIGLIGEVKMTMVSEASDILLALLKQLRSENKELKRELKEDRAQLKATLEKSESSSSSESSDSECGEVVDTKTLRSNVLKPSQYIETPSEDDMRQPEDVEAAMVTEEATLVNSLIELENSDSIPQIRIRVPCSGFGSEYCCTNGFKNDHNNRLVEGASTKKIEICMGGKCKKLGAAALLEEFERKVGAEGTVVACKCMGKCKTAPNIRVLNSPSGREAKSDEDSVGLGIKPTFTGVGLQDVDMIVANLYGKNVDDECLMLSA